jgi:methylated-DNA-protein-cysteine methyltransferase-like protein
MKNSLSERIKIIIKNIPKGKVATYGQIAAMAGNPRAARQVGWILHSSSQKEKMPWHRVINSEGKISLPKYSGYQLQRRMLENEGIEFNKNELINLTKYRWNGAFEIEK